MVVGKEVIWPPFFVSENGEKWEWGYYWGYR